MECLDINVIYSLPEGITREYMSHISLPQATGYCMVANKNAHSSASMDTLCMEDWSCTDTCGYAQKSSFSVLVLKNADSTKVGPKRFGYGWNDECTVSRGSFSHEALDSTMLELNKPASAS